MELQPVQHTKTPSYPTRREVLAGAAGFALAGLCGRMCVFAATEDGKTIVAPLFEHGDGRGATGCIVVSPPVFLSEEEAMQIIREELAKCGVKLGKGSKLKSVHIPHRLLELSTGKITEVETATSQLKLSGEDDAKKIAVEFISKEHYRDVGGPSTRASVHPYDFKEVAQYVATKVREQGKDAVYLGMFYDPVAREPDSKTPDNETGADRKKRRQKDEEARKAQAKDLLRQQVQDFAAWLKEKKVVR
jgi:hypothetical protein